MRVRLRAISALLALTAVATAALFAACESDVLPTAVPTATVAIESTSTRVPVSTYTATPEPVVVLQPTPTATPSPAATDTATPEPLPTETSTPEQVATDTATAEPVPTDTATAERSPTETATPEPVAPDPATAEPSPTGTSTPEPVATDTATPEPTTPDTATPEPTPTSTPTIEEVATLRLSELISWFGDDRLPRNTRAAANIKTIWLRNSALGDAIAKLPWINDDVTLEEEVQLEAFTALSANHEMIALKIVELQHQVRYSSENAIFAVSAFARITESDPALALTVLDLGWVVDRIARDYEPSLLYLLGEIAEFDLAAAHEIVELEWFHSGDAEVAVAMLEDLQQQLPSKLPPRTDQDVDGGLASIPWIADGIQSDEEDFAASQLEFIFRRAPDLGRRVAGYEWIADGIDPGDEFAIGVLASVADRYVDVAREISGFDWVIDGLDETENRALIAVFEMSVGGYRHGSTLVFQPWFQDGVNEMELRFLRALESLVSDAPGIIERLDEYEWLVSSEIDVGDLEIVLSVRDVALVDPDFAEWMLSNSVDLSPAITRYAFDSLSKIVTREAPDYQALLEEDWFVDGLDKREAIFIGALAAARWQPGITFVGDNDTLDFDLLSEHHIEARVVDLPLAGEVNLWVVKHYPFSPDEPLMDYLASAVLNAEDFMGEKFPTNDVIVLVGEGNHPGPSYHRGGDVVLRQRERGKSVSEYVVLHEIGHYYFGVGVDSGWLAEGGADLIASHAAINSGVTTNEALRRELSDNLGVVCIDEWGLENLQQVVDFYTPVKCTYDFGQLFLLELGDVLGRENLSLALSEIHRAAENGHGTSEKEIYETFMRHADSETVVGTVDLYLKRHSGRFLFDDYHEIPDVEIPAQFAEAHSGELSWSAGPLDRQQARLLEALIRIWELDTQLAAELINTEWVKHPRGYVEASTITDIAAIASTDLELARWISSYPGVEFGLVYWMHTFIESVRRIHQNDSSLAWDVAESPWAVEDFFMPTSLFARLIADLAAEDVEVARRLLVMPWVADGLSGREFDALQRVRLMWRHSPELVRTVAGLDWVSQTTSDSDAVGNLELILHYAELISASSPDLGLDIMRSAWFQDGVDEFERRALDYVAVASENNLDAANEIASLDWFADGSDDVESLAVNVLVDLAVTHDEVFERVMALSWVRDDIAAIEEGALFSLLQVVNADPQTALRVAGSAWFTDGIDEAELRRLRDIADSLR